MNRKPLRAMGQGRGRSIPARRPGAVLGLVTALAVACGGPDAPPPAGGRPLVAATVFPLYEFARQVAGDQAEVVAVVPAGVEPHDWEPSPQDLVRLQRARLVVYNGAGLEPWIGKVIAEGSRRDRLSVDATAGISLLSAGDHAHDPKAGTGAGGTAARATPDPHVWLDPRLAQHQVETIRTALGTMNPGQAAAYDERARAFTARLAALDDAFEQGLRACARRAFVTSHAAFGYLARRYRLTQVAVTGLAPEAEPSPADLAALVRFARAHQVQYVFFETLVSARLAETLAREVGARTLVLNPIEGLTREEAAAGKGYLSLMEDNLRNLRTALECR